MYKDYLKRFFKAILSLVKLFNSKRKVLTALSNVSFTRLILKWAALTALWLTVAVAVIFIYYSKDLPDTDKLQKITKTPNIKILDESGKLVANYGEYYGEYLDYKDFPETLIQAVLATEDRRFFEHIGIDIWGLFRATVANIKAGRIVQGGSTITQQLAKNSFLTPDRTLKRKIQEMMLALWLESKFSKKQILTMYLNRVYLGGGNYGADSAAKSYFGKSARNINLTESAIIAGLLRAPSKYSPSNNPKLAAERGQQVIINMQDAGFISLDNAEKAQKSLKKDDPKTPTDRMYYADWIVDQLSDLIGNVDSDIIVYTTINTSLQKAAEDAIHSVIAEFGSQNVSQGALVAIQNDGKVLAVVGGTNYKKSQFNRATQAQRSPGSSFKSFVYLTAFENGFSPDSELEDKPIDIEGWAPENYTKEYYGSMSLSEAFAKSINSIAVQLGQLVGMENVVETAARMGIKSKLVAFPSAALGTNEVNLMEITQAYTVFANDGMKVPIYGIVKITDSDSNVLYEKPEEDAVRVADINAIRDMRMIMSDVINYGTGQGAKIGRPAAGKTGTSQEYRDAWFIGYTPQITTGVWFGNDNNSSMKKDITGGKIATVAWREFMTIAMQDQPVIALPTDRVNMFNSGDYMNYLKQNQQKSLDSDGRSFWEKLFNNPAPPPPAQRKEPWENPDQNEQINEQNPQENLPTEN